MDYQQLPSVSGTIKNEIQYENPIFNPPVATKKLLFRDFTKTPIFSQPFWSVWNEIRCYGPTDLPGDVLVLWPPKSPRLQCGLSQRTWDRKVVPFKKKHTKLGGGNSNIFYFHPENWGNDSQFDYIIFFKGVGKNHPLVKRLPWTEFSFWVTQRIAA